MYSLRIIGALLLLLFRRNPGVLLSLTSVTLSMVATFSPMLIMGSPMTGSSQMLPNFPLAVCVADSVHILAHFYRNYDAGMEKSRAIALSLQHTSLEVVMTSLTTAVGLASFVFADLRPIIAMGVFGALGPIFALFYAVALLPALLSVLRVRRRASTGGPRHTSRARCSPSPESSRPCSPAWSRATPRPSRWRAAFSST